MITITYYKSGSVGVQCPPGEALYALGMKPANFPVPATMDNAVMALFCQPEVTRWSVEWFKRELRR